MFQVKNFIQIYNRYFSLPSTAFQSSLSLKTILTAAMLLYLIDLSQRLQYLSMLNFLPQFGHNMDDRQLIFYSLIEKQQDLGQKFFILICRHYRTIDAYYIEMRSTRASR